MWVEYYTHEKIVYQASTDQLTESPYWIHHRVSWDHYRLLLQSTGGRQKAKLIEITYLEMIQKHLTRDTLELSAMIKYLISVPETIESAATFMTRLKPSNTDSIASLVHDLSKGLNYHPDIRTYRLLIENGDILNPLRREIATYDAYFNTIDMRYEEINDFKKEHIYAYLSKHYNLSTKKY
ncbi:hypothetical protein [Reichenbachiella sp.]|uniref:hypothetical protein n=1 Tax=Reichenbachiella sp. TaxID=2184521 RepID=UPI003BB13AAE